MVNKMKKLFYPQRLTTVYNFSLFIIALIKPLPSLLSYHTILTEAIVDLCPMIYTLAQIIRVSGKCRKL
jgi:transcriptional regulatory protein LevR